MLRHALFLSLVSTFGLLQACSGDDNAAASADTAAVADSANPATAALPVGATFDAATSTFQDLQGRGLEIASFAGKKVFVNYWATWCAPCIREIPSIARAAAALENENYLFVLASDESPETISNFILDRGFGGHFIKLNGYFGAHGIDAVPSSSLYDENGQLLQSWAGAFEWDSPEMLQQLRNPQAVATPQSTQPE
jgi:thiol-disulfide isomerase/thioredoxin